MSCVLSDAQCKNKAFCYAGVLLTIDKQPDSFYTMHNDMSKRLSLFLYGIKEGFLSQVWRCYSENYLMANVSVDSSYFLVNYSFSSEQGVSHLFFPPCLSTLHLMTLFRKKTTTAKSRWMLITLSLFDYDKNFHALRNC